MDNLIKIITFTYPQEAYLAKSLLEASGITVIMQDEFTAQVNNFYSNAIGGVKLFVDVGQAEEALSILKETGYIQDENVKPKEDLKLEVFPTDHRKICPYCNSTNVAKKKMPGYLFIFSFLLLGFPIPFLRKEYFCFDCGKEWIVRR